MKSLPPHQDPEERYGSIATVRFEESSEGANEQRDWLYKRIAYLERELAGALNGIYTKLADQWNAYQATARPDNRNVHRAEAAGELARKLAELLIGLAYDKDVSDLIRDLMMALAGDRQFDAARHKAVHRALPGTPQKPR